jgi:dienelactone hydrolase
VQRVHRLAAAFLFLLAAAALAAGPIHRRWRAAELLKALSSPDVDRQPLVERELRIPGRDGPIRARLYRRADLSQGPGLVVSHGVHYRGIDERRLVPFARELARAGLVVLTPELDDLTDYRITRRGLEVIMDSALWLGAQRELATSARVGLLGFSFAGGLSLVAASEPELQDRVAYATSVGGHHDLSRVLRFLLTDRIETPDGTSAMKAHEYGQIVLLYQNLGQFVPTADLPAMQGSVRAWLQEDRPRSLALASLRTTEAADRLFWQIESGRLQERAPELVRLVEAHPAELAALSPRGRLKRVKAPVYLLHGTGDSVIPPSETLWASRELTGKDHAALVSPLLEHVEIDKTAGISDQLALVDFMAGML